MKRTFLAKRNALMSSADVSWGAYSLALVILLLFVRLFAPNFFWYIFTPVFRSADFLAAESHFFLSSFGDTAVLTLENERLHNENNALTNENQALLQKAASLSALLDTPVSGGSSTSEILAGVVARPPESPYDMLILAEGARAGIAVGMEAFGAGGVPIGVVSSVLDNVSRVTLFSSPSMSVTGLVGRADLPAQTGVSVTITGSGAGTMSASLSRSAGVMVGDTVFVPGPGMLPIGTVVRIDDDSSAPSVTLRIKPMLNLFSIAWVVVRDTGTVLLDAFSRETSLP